MLGLASFIQRIDSGPPPPEFDHDAANAAAAQALTEAVNEFESRRDSLNLPGVENVKVAFVFIFWVLPAFIPPISLAHCVYLRTIGAVGRCDSRGGRVGDGVLRREHMHAHTHTHKTHTHIKMSFTCQQAYTSSNSN